MTSPLRILLLADSDDETKWLTETLRDSRPVCEYTRVDDEARCREALGAGNWDLVICAFHGPRPPRALAALRNGQTGDLHPILVADGFAEVAGTAHRLGAAVCLRADGLQHLGPTIEQVLDERSRRIQRDQWLTFEEGQREVLEDIAAGAALPGVLEKIVLLIERQAEGMFCSIVLLDSETGRIHTAAAPHLPRALIEGIEGSQIGPNAGSCGAAAFRRERVVVEDLGTHPYWADYRHLVLPFGLRACWSSPIFSSGGAEVLGTFAMYYREARSPSARELQWVARATHLAAIAISRDRTERALRSSEARYRQIVDTAYEGVWLLDVDACTLFVNGRTAQMLGYSANEMLGRSLFDFMEESSREVAQGEFLERLRTISEQQEFRFCRKGGGCFWAMLAGSPIRDENQHVIGALAMLTDITRLKSAVTALRQSEAEFRVIFENAAIGMALVAADGRVVRSNPALQQFLGFTEAEFRSRTFAELMHSDDGHGDGELQRSLGRGERNSYQSEGRYLTKTGATVWGRLTASAVHRSEVPEYAIIMVENVTERRKMEEAVRSSERLRRLMYRAVSDVLYYVGVESDGRFRFLSVNPAFLKATGLQESEVVGRLVSEVIPEPARTEVLANYQRALRERRTITWDEESVYPAGVKYGEVSIAPIFDQDGNGAHLLGTVHDVTERRNAQERIAEQAALLDQAKDVIMVRDLEGVVRYWNKGAERLYGWSSDEAVGRNIRELLYKDTTAFEGAHRRVLDDGEWKGELIQLTKTGKKVVVECSWTLLCDLHGRGKSVFVINTDVTERKRLEALMIHNQRLESLGTLAGGIAHDFNNILAAVVGNLHLVKKTLTAEHPGQASLAEIENATARATELVAQILMFGRQHEPKRELVQLQPIVEEALRLLRTALPAMATRTRFDPKLPPVFGDPTQIHQVVMNLGTNAAHSMNGRGTFRVNVGPVVLENKLVTRSTELPPGEYVQLVVADTGSGIEEATLERIFEPFFSTKAEGVGTGLGLSVVHGIVESHHGGIAVHSIPGRGTEFTVYFPAAKAIIGETGAALPEIARGTGGHLLCLDDDVTTLRSTSRLLERLGYRVTGYTDLARALEVFASNVDEFDAVVAHLSALARSSWEDLVRRLQRIRPALPIVMLAGRMTPEDVRAARELGIRELVSKPDAGGELGPALRRILGGEPAGKPLSPHA